MEIQTRAAPPPGILFLRKLRGKDLTVGTYRASVLAITFVAYALYHASRKPPSIVKSVLDPDGAAAASVVYSHYTQINPAGDNRPQNLQRRPGWAPFDGETGKIRLGEVDVAFLASYALGMYFAGHLGDRVDLRRFLAAGMAGSGIFVCMFGLGQYWEIHRLAYYVAVQMAAGVCQATGWPSVVTIVGHWFGKRKRGLIMGVWNAHTSVGNIVGSLVAAAVLRRGWGWSFVVPGLMLALGGGLVWCFLVVDPADVGLPSPYNDAAAEGRAADADPVSEQASLLTASAALNGSAKGSGTHDDVESQQQHLDAAAAAKQGEEVPAARAARHDPAVGFLEAWRIPGVASFALCLFFAKLIAYTFLYWLPFYIRQTPIAGEILDERTAGNLSTLFDVGGVAGGILAGHLSDWSNARAITAAGFMYGAIPALFLYRAYGGASLAANVALMLLMGALINGPYSLITTAVSADLGTHASLRGNGRALATVTAIIDGTGSMGAAVGPLLTGFTLARGWAAVFAMLMASALLAALLLTKLVAAELADKVAKRPRAVTEGATGT